jgi:hypothetical protein
MKKCIIKISLIIFCLLLLASCGGSSDDSSNGGDTGTDTTAPSNITLAGLSTTESSITFTWTDPSDTDLDHITITCSDGTDSESADITAGTETHTQGTLNSGALGAETCYTFTIAAEDSSGNISETETLLVMTSPSGAGELTYTLISSAEELYNIRDDLAGNYYLTQDISLSDYSSDEGWEPIGYYGNCFAGIFFGAGHTISDLIIDSSSERQGLFGCSTGLGMYYLGLEDVDVNGGKDTGGLVGSLAVPEDKTHTISHCYVTGSVSSDSSYYVGGLVGYLAALNDTSIISHCYSTADVSSGGASTTILSSPVGGLVGINDVDSGTSSITDCYTTGAVTAYSSQAGGLVGKNVTHKVGAIILTDCYATGEVGGTSELGGLVGFNEAKTADGIIEISGCHAAGDVTGGDYLGGLIGSNENEGTINISDCDATGSVDGGSYLGGLIGYDACGGAGTLYHCTASGAVSGNDYIGGLIGQAYTMDGCDITISCSYATGNVSGDSYVGGFCGANYTPTICDSTITIENAYATGDVSGTSDYIGGLIGDNDYLASTDYPNFDISNCYATGAVSGTSSSMGGLLGGAVTVTTGNLETIENCFYDSETTGYNAATTTWTDAGTATSDMQTESTFTNAGWDFIDETANGTDDIWTLDDSATDPVNNGYPYLADLPPA